MADGSGSERSFGTPSGTFELRRHPHRPRSTLRAWDAADAYVLRYLAEQEDTGRFRSVAILNDGFGALACGLHQLGPTSVVDTITAELGTAGNLERNHLPPIPVHPEVDDVPNGLDLVVVKVPKSLGQLEDQLHRLAPKLDEDTVILGSGMVRDIHTSTLQLFETIIGPTTTSLAERKARLIHCTVDPAMQRPDNPWPVSWRDHGLTVVNRGGVFSARSLDIGSRFLLEHLPTVTPAPGERSATIVDLGCGNGVLGTAAAAMINNAVHVDTAFVDTVDVDTVFVDISAAAIDSARRSWAANHGDREARFLRSDRLINAVERGTVDLVLNNPPFHDERAVGDATVWDMFVDSHAVLRPGGELRVIGNRHLGHHSRLKKIFGNCKTVASNRKFVVLSSIR